MHAIRIDGGAGGVGADCPRRREIFTIVLMGERKRIVVDRPRPALFLRALEIRRGARYEYFVTVCTLCLSNGYMKREYWV